MYSVFYPIIAYLSGLFSVSGRRGGVSRPTSSAVPGCSHSAGERVAEHCSAEGAAAGENAVQNDSRRKTRNSEVCLDENEIH